VINNRLHDVELMKL